MNSEIFKSGIVPELGDSINTAVKRFLLDLNVCLPGKVTAYDRETQFADVEIQLYQKANSGKLEPYPVIPNVPVKWPRAMGGSAFIHLPLQAGDDVLLVFAQRSIDNWKTQGGMSDPDDPRLHHLTDAYALVGGSALPDAFSPATDNAIEIVNDEASVQIFPDAIEIKKGDADIRVASDAISITNGDASIQVFPDGKFQIKNGSNELIDLLQQLADTLSTDTVNTPSPQPLNAASTYATIASELDTLKGP